ncbi:MAG: AMP-binding protein [Nitrospirota bacterium]
MRIGEKGNIPELFIESARRSKNRPAFQFFDRSWKEIKYDELLATTTSISSHLIRQGIRKGDKVSIISENRPEWCMSYLAISFSDATAVPIDFQLGSQEIRNLLHHSDSKMVFHSARTEEQVRRACDELLEIHSVHIELINFDSPFFDEIKNISDLRVLPVVSKDDVASIIYTSGTTGLPKGVELTHNNFCSDGDAILKTNVVTPDDKVIAILPLHHTYPFTCTFLIPLLLGITIVFPPSLKGPDLVAAIHDKGVTVLVGVPQLLELMRNGIFHSIDSLPRPLANVLFGLLKFCGMIRRHWGINTGKLLFRSVHKALGNQFRFFVSGGAKLNPEIMKDLEALGFSVVEGYGLTETSPVVTLNPLRKRKPGSAGIPLPGVEMRVVDPDTHKELRTEEEGEISIKGPMVMKGYYKNAEATKEAIQDGWFFSGDLGFMDREGSLFITGRLKEVIVLSSGKNIYPEEVEREYQKIPLIKEICVFGAEGDASDTLRAVIVPDFDYAKKAQIGNIGEALKWEINNVSLHLPPHRRIRGHTILNQPLPRTPLGKLRRFMVEDIVRGEGETLKIERKDDERLVRDEVGRKIVDCIKPLLKEKIPVRYEDNLELDLGLDSLARIELVVSLEKAFSAKLPETFAAEVQTVGELVEKMKKYGISQIEIAEEVTSRTDILMAEPPPEDRRKVGLHHGIMDRIIIILGLFVLKALMKILFRVKASGIENLPDKGPYIIAPNHTSYLDGFVVVVVQPSRNFKELYSLGFQKYFTGKFKTYFARLAHIIPVDPETYLSKALKLSAYVLKNGKSLLIFPEGGRSYDGELMEFKKGIGILAQELNVPVVPVYIKGTFESLPRGRLWPKFNKIQILFGKPFYPSELDISKKPDSMDKYQFFARQLMERVKRLRDQSGL